ncbi:MAG: uncharacterized protein QOE70_1400 [Chthoniobacter sp.]|jgi:uncharacterized protein YqjF (DUF2071 family)|nr:uncharacterized protein [Chthoniobacter sp.]
MSHAVVLMASIFLTAEWRSLVMLNYRIDPEVLAPYLPRGLELDFWNGEALVSMVGFLFQRCRVLGLAVPRHQSFEEVNLRFYVRRRVGEETRRGVVFVREIVPRHAIALTARIFYNEPYVAMPMRHALEGRRIEFAWKWRGAWQSLSAVTSGEPQAIAPASEEEFIFEHYWGYTRQRDGGTVEYQVEHPRWRTWRVESASLDCDVAALYGPAFLPVLKGPPRSVFVAEGSAVEVRRGVRVA